MSVDELLSNGFLKMKFQIQKVHKKIYDGEYEGFVAAEDIAVNLNGPEILFNPRSLSPLEQINESGLGLNALDVANEVGCEIDQFDGGRIYQGSKRGTKLFYGIDNTSPSSRVLIISCGEFQSGRFLSILEGVLERSDSRLS